MSKRTIQTYEYDTLKVSSDNDNQETGELARKEFEALARFNDRHKSRYFTLGNRRITFKQYVGVIRVGGLTLEILPKLGMVTDADAEKWQNALLDMLRIGGLLKIESASISELKRRRMSLFEIVIEQFLEETRKLVMGGLARKYIRHETNRNALKGRLLFGENLKRNLIHKERFYTSHNQYNRNNHFNQILKQALLVIRKHCGSWRQANEAAASLEFFDEVDCLQETREIFGRLYFDRNTESYRMAIGLAELILQHYTPDISSGHRPLLAILFDMNRVFETYVGNVLKRKARENRKINVKNTGTSRNFWKYKNKNKSIRPDIILDSTVENKKRKVILDVKWKVPKDRMPADADLKQIYVYNLQYGANEGTLVYPSNGQEYCFNPGEYEALGEMVTPPGWKFNHTCAMCFLPIFNEVGTLDDKWADDLLSSLDGAGLH